MDEQPVQLVRETRTPGEATAAHPRRGDYEYERAATAAMFVFTEPPAGWREGDNTAAADEGGLRRRDIGERLRPALRDNAL